jgi:hypothetical protein
MIGCRPSLTRLVRKLFPLGLAVAVVLSAGCVTAPPMRGQVIWETGSDQVRIDPDPGKGRYTHPAQVTPNDMARLLRGVRSGEHRNVIHQLFSGEAKKTRTFRDDEIALLAGPLSSALAKAGPGDRVYFHLSESALEGGEVSTTGWLAIQDSVLVLQLSEAHDLHAPGSDISKYIRSLPDIPVPPTPFEATFEPEEFLAGQASLGSWFAPDQLEELRILYREALSAVPPYQLSVPQAMPKGK